MYCFVCILYFKTEKKSQNPKPQGLPNSTIQWSLLHLCPAWAPSVIFAADDTSSWNLSPPDFLALLYVPTDFLSILRSSSCSSSHTWRGFLGSEEASLWSFSCVLCSGNPVYPQLYKVLITIATNLLDISYAPGIVMSTWCIHTFTPFSLPI